MYRQDIALKFTKYSEAKMQSTWRDARRTKHLEGPAAKSIGSVPSSVEQLLLRNTWGHLKAVAGNYKAITLPQRADGELQLVTKSFDAMLYDEEVIQSNVEDVVEDVSDEVALLEDAVPPLVCFKVCWANLGKTKTMATFFPDVGPKLSEGSMAVTFHHAELVDGGGLSVSINPRDCGNGFMNCVVCTDFIPGCSLEGLVANAHGWTSPSADASKALYTLPLTDIPLPELNEAVAKLLDAHAHDPDDDKGTVEGDADAEPWRSLLEFGFVVAAVDPAASPSPTNRFRFTPEGIREVRSKDLYTKSHGLFEVRELPLPQLTPFEMARRLQAEGWEWKLFPKAPKDRLSLQHDTSLAIGCYYTVGNNFIGPYLQCLLSAADLREKFDIQYIPHYGGRAPVKHFVDLLKGHNFVLDDQPPAKRPALRNEFSDDEAPMAIEDEAPMAIEDVPEEELTIEQMLERYIEEDERLLQEEGKPDSEPDQPDEDIIEPVDPGDEGAGEPPGSEAQDPPEPAAMAIPAVASNVADFRGRQKLKIESWGAINIARVKGAFECRCPFHKLSQKTDCKKTFSYTDESEEIVLASLRHWANTARNFNRQRHHMSSMRTCFDVPFQSYDVLLAAQIPEADKPAPGTVKTDKELDQEEEEQQQLRARGRWQGKGRGQQRQERGPDGRARGRGRGQARGRQGRGEGQGAASDGDPSTSSSSSS